MKKIFLLGMCLLLFGLLVSAETTEGTSLNVGESIDVGGRVVKLVSVSSTKAVVDVEGVTGIFQPNEAPWILNGVSVGVKSIISKDRLEDSSAELTLSRGSDGTYLEVGQTVKIGMKTVKLNAVSETHASVSVDEVSESIASDEEKTLNGISINVGSLYARKYAADSAALLHFSWTTTGAAEEVTDTGEERQESLEEIATCASGCLLDETCLSYGMRKKGQFCDTDKVLKQQMGEGEVCDNSYECKSNVCVAGECLSASFIQKIINWLKEFFS